MELQILNDYFFVDNSKQNVLLEQSIIKKGDFDPYLGPCIVGINEKGEEVTFPIIRFKSKDGYEGVDVYNKFTFYRLGEKHKDFQEMDKAILNKEKVIYEWRIFKMDKDNEFTIIGKTYPDSPLSAYGRVLHGIIAGQNGNHIIVNDTSYFVLWPNSETKYALFDQKPKFEFKYRKAWNRDVVPILFPE